MALRHAIGDVIPIYPGVWRTKLAPADVRRIGEGKISGGARSVVGVTQADFDLRTNVLSVGPDAITVFNIGSSDEVLVFDLGPGDASALPVIRQDGVKPSNSRMPGTLGHGDRAFIEACGHHLKPDLVVMAERLLGEVRGRYPGNLREGLARKWVNYPGNFLAITIQNRDQSFAVHVKGMPEQFTAPSLEIKPDRPSYCRFKLEHGRQLEDALRVILRSAQMSEGY